MREETAPNTQAIFGCIEQGDTEGIARLLNADAMLVHARHADRTSITGQHCSLPPPKGRSPPAGCWWSAGRKSTRTQ